MAFVFFRFLAYSRREEEPEREKWPSWPGWGRSAFIRSLLVAIELITVSVLTAEGGASELSGFGFVRRGLSRFSLEEAPGGPCSAVWYLRGKLFDIARRKASRTNEE